MTKIRRAPCLSDGAIAALREDLLDANTGVPMVLAWDSVYKALDEIAWLRVELATAKAQLTALTTAPIHLTPEEDESLKAYAAELNAEIAKDCLVVGQFYRHPISDRLLVVTRGSYLGGDGRFSNFWHWNYFDDDFSPVDESDEGYGWTAKPVERPQVCDHCGVPSP